MTAAYSRSCNCNYFPDWRPEKEKSKGGMAVPVTFCNNDERYDIDLYWLDYRGKERYYGRMKPGHWISMNTYANHPWIAYASWNTQATGLLSLLPQEECGRKGRADVGYQETFVIQP